MFVVPGSEEAILLDLLERKSGAAKGSSPVTFVTLFSFLSPPNPAGAH